MFVGLAACSGLRRRTLLNLQLSVRRGTASEDGACGNDKVGRHGLQRIVAAGIVAAVQLRCGYSGAVHRRKTAQATTWLVGMATEVVRASGATR